MNPDELEKLLKALGIGADATRTSLPDDIRRMRASNNRSVSAAGRNIPISQHLIDALEPKRVTRADKIIGAASDFTPIAGVEKFRQAYHKLLGGDKTGASIDAVLGALALAPGGAGEKAAAEPALAAAAKGHPEIQAVLREMQQASGGVNLPRITSIDPEKGKLLAKAYEALPKNDPAAKASYDALNREVAAQKKRLEDAGFKFEFVDEDPYKSSKEMMADVAQNRRLKVFKTGDDAVHPYMTREQNNDFRAVHDLLAHAGEGHQFGPVGEENAYRVHSSTLSKDALPALASETRGQNSWVNFGPNAHLPVRERPFAEQKAALFPEHLTGDYDAMTPQLPEKYAILTAENPHGMPATPERNAQHNLALEKHLTRLGVPFEKVKGAYTDDATGNLLTENSYLIHGLEPHEAERIGRQFGQNGVVTHAGYHDLAGGTLHPTSGLSYADDAPYTELPNGRRVRSNIDWEKNNPLMEAMGDSVAAAPTSLAGVAMRHKRSGKVYSIDGFDGGHGAVWANVQNERGPMTWQDRDHLFEDGFTTSDGRFVNRADALEIAKARHVYNGQERARLEPDGRPGLHTEAIEDPNPPYRKAFETHADFQARRGEGAVPRNIAQGDSVATRGAERIVNAATRTKDGAVYHGPIHIVAHQNAILDKKLPWKPDIWRDGFGPDDYLKANGAEDGFLTSNGRFVSRDEAEQIADAAEQGGGRDALDYRFNGNEFPQGFKPAIGDSVATGAAHWHAKHMAAEVPDAAQRYRDVAADIRAYPDQRRNDLIDALRGEAYMRPEPYRAPAVITRDRWKPTSRGVFDRARGSELYREPAPLEFEAKAKPKATGLHPAAEQIANDPRVVERILSDVEKGRDMGGIGWYGLLPVRNSIEEIGGPFSFRDINMAGAAGSAQTSTSNELANMSLNLFGRKRGLDTEGAREEFLRRFPNSKRPFYSEDHRKLFDRGMERGIMGPNNPTDGALKIPNYFHNRMLGATGVPIDTHEQRMMSQATGISMDDIKAAMAAGGNNYEALTQPYHRVAEQLSLTPDQVQASRWIGGALETKLKSQPRGDFLQTLEDGLLHTARVRGLDESPKGLRNLWGNIVKGDDFFMPFYGEGGFPVY